MTARAALIAHLLLGRKVSIKNCYFDFGLSNCSREIIRMVEKPFNVVCDREHKKGVSRHGQQVVWVEYTLKRNFENSNGIAEMTKYLMEKGNNRPKGKVVGKELFS